MARRARGFLDKRHRRCPNRGDDTRCDCAWKGRYRGEEVTLAKWASTPLNPRERFADRRRSLDTSAIHSCPQAPPK